MDHDDCPHVCEEDHAATFHEQGKEMVEMTWLCYCFVCSMVVFA